MMAWVIFGSLALIGGAFAIMPLARARGSRFAACVTGALIAGAGIALYLALGRPDLATRAFEPVSAQDLPALVASLSLKVRERPTDRQGWLLLGRGYFALGDAGEAAKALAQAIRLAEAQHAPQGELASILTDYGVAASQAAGAVTPDAETAFRQSLAADPTAVAPRYYLGIAAATRGDDATAERLWQALLDEAPADAPYRGELVDRLAALKARATARGEAAPDIQAMVENLAARLKASPDDLDGWRRLIRAYSVLGDVEKARAALAMARSHFSGRADALATLTDTAHENNLD